jgi:hypothetical protein
VYGPTTDAELRVITCGGSFNRATGHYTDNIIVFATLSKIVPVTARVTYPAVDHNTLVAMTRPTAKSDAIVVSADSDESSSVAAPASSGSVNATMLPADKTKLAGAAAQRGPWSGPPTTYPIVKPRSSASIPDGAATVARPL